MAPVLAARWWRIVVRNGDCGLRRACIVSRSWSWNPPSAAKTATSHSCSASYPLEGESSICRRPCPGKRAAAQPPGLPASSGVDVGVGPAGIVVVAVSETAVGAGHGEGHVGVEVERGAVAERAVVDAVEGWFEVSFVGGVLSVDKNRLDLL